MDNNTKLLNSWNPSDRKIFDDFIKKLNSAGFDVIVTSALRTRDQQAEYHNKDERNAKPGTSDHEKYRAIDINCIKNGKQYFSKTPNKEWEKAGIIQIAKNSGLYWGGDWKKYKDRVHFYHKNKTSNSKAFTGKIKSSSFNSEVGQKSIEAVDSKPSNPYSEDEEITRISGYEEVPASGIWQIIKFVADQYSLSQNINDATIADSQGSLLSYVQKVIQQPWLQFFGDTVGDQYYFFSRKEPFDYLGFKRLPIIKNIQENEILSIDLDWYSGDVYSWYQLIPKGAFLSNQETMFTYIKAVFFNEYAEVWGSKPYSRISNYVNFIKVDDKDKMWKKALKDLRYMVESNAYLPFTRTGTIVISGDTTIKRGYRIYNISTGEYFYVDSVSHNYTVGESGPSFMTTLRVSRGIKRKHFSKYFLLIDFDNPKSELQKYEKEIKDFGLFFYFDNGRNYLIDMNEVFKSKSRTDIKMNNQIAEFPSLREELNSQNKDSLSKIVALIKKHKGQKFICAGSMDEDNIRSFSRLSRQRATLVKQLAIQEYLKNNNDISKAELEKNIILLYNKGTDGKAYYEDDKGKIGVFNDSDNLKSSFKERAYKRNCIFYVQPYKRQEDKEVRTQGVAWKVNKKYFNFFINRKQSNSDVQ